MPPPVALSDFGGDVKKWLEGLWIAYLEVVREPRAYVCGIPVTEKFDPIYDGKTSTFWHIVSEGEVEEDRTIEPGRAEQIRTVRWLIDAAGGPGCRWWLQNRRAPGKGSREQVALATDDLSYLVILVRRPKVLLLWTAYPVTHQSQRDRLRKECDAFHAANPGARLMTSLRHP